MKDLIDQYLEEIARNLRGPAMDSHRTLLETEDHLRQSAADLMAQGKSPDDAQQEAISRFGTASDVAHGHNAGAWAFSPIATFRALVASGVELIAAAFVVIGISAGVAYLASRFTSQQSVFGLPASAVSTMRSCSYWLAIHPTAANCQQAGTWEAASDMTWMLGTLGVVGVVLFGIMRVLRRNTLLSLVAVPATVGASISTTMFFVASIGLFGLGQANAVIAQAWGRGLWYSESASAFAAFIVSGIFLLRALRPSFLGNS